MFKETIVNHVSKFDGSVSQRVFSVSITATLDSSLFAYRFTLDGSYAGGGILTMRQIDNKAAKLIKGWESK